MKTTQIHLAKTLTLLLFGLSLGGCFKSQTVAITFKPDGSVEAIQTMTFPRATVVEALAERTLVDEGGVDLEEETPAAEATPGAAMTDAAISAAIKKRFDEEVEGIEGVERKLLSTTPTPAEVTISVQLTYRDLKTFTTHGTELVSAFGIGRLKLEKSEAGKLAITLVPAARGRRAKAQLEMQKQHLIANECTLALTLTLPGAVLESPFPEKEGSSTTFTINGKEKEKLDAGLALLMKPLVVVAEPGELALDPLPLDSRKLMETMYVREEPPAFGADLPIEEAMPGYRCLADLVTTRATRHFPEGEAYLAKGPYRWNSEADGTHITARLIAPPERRILQVQEIKILSAVDDNDRAVPFELDREGEGRFRSHHFSSGSSDDPEREAQLKFELGLPAADAEAIEVLKGEVTLLGFAKWRQKRIESLKADAAAVIDLNDVLPGASLKILKFGAPEHERNRSQGEMTLQVDGPATIAGMQFSIQIPGEENINSYVNNDKTLGEGERRKRTLTLGYHIYSSDEAPAAGTPQLVIKYPEGLKREKVPVTLEALDLF